MKRIITIFLILLTLAFPLGCSSSEDSGNANSQQRIEITPADIANEMSLYAVEVECGNEASSGYIIASDATSVVVATCYHAVDGASPKIVRFQGETDFVSSDKVTFYAYDDLFDIAFLKVELTENHGKSVLGKKIATIKVGDEAFVLGNSLGDGLSFSQGVVSVSEEVVSFSGGNRPVLRISNALNGGDSGAPVFNKSNDFLGLVQGRKTLNDTSVVYGVGYALPGSIVNALYKKSLTVDATKKIKYPNISYATVEKTENNIKSTYPTVTISGESVSYTFARKDDGLYLDNIVGSTAVNKGVKLDKVNGVAVTSITAFTETVLSAEEGITFTSGAVNYGV